MRIIVTGAGIGGSVLALALEQADMDFVVLEQAPELTEVGAGIQLSPNGVRILEWLGLGDELAGFGVEPGGHQLRDWKSGDIVLETPLKSLVKTTFGSPYYHAHRADLIDALARRVNPDRLRLNAKVVSVSQDSGKVTATLENGSSETGDVLIGADGIHSVIRNQVFNPEAPRPSGYLAWRGMVPAERAAHLKIEKQSVAVMGPRLSIVFYYVSGGAKLNWVAIGAGEDEMRESWSQTASKEDVQKSFEGWYDHAKGLVDLTDELFVTALHDREPLPTWIDGRIALMGDAAHAMLPYHAQGAVQSIEDAWVLARCLQLGHQTLPGDPAGALLKYESLRKDRAQRLQLHSRNAERWYHLDDADEVARRNARLAAHAENSDTGLTPQQIWLFGYDAEKAVLGTDDDWRALREW
ncbi:MAG: hydroxylase [Rhodospirillaceae bacterium]|jgi:salicylate hydroxylase|nr:hydroxylase [Rhodospirillaceae bacterium]MBT5895101.1 hydroxylase [Rhodospirillaceae bacterium]MBT7756922.1 hydroxylase [Rhodospirillaceae bacterium]